MEENLKKTSPIVQACIKSHGITFANVLLSKAGHLAQLGLDVGGDSPRCDYWGRGSLESMKSHMQVLSH